MSMVSVNGCVCWPVTGGGLSGMDLPAARWQLGLAPAALNWIRNCMDAFIYFVFSGLTRRSSTKRSPAGLSEWSTWWRNYWTTMEFATGKEL